jgi:HEAT repeat protein
VFNIFSDLYLNLAFWTGIAAAVLVLLLVLTILSLRVRNLHLVRRERDFVAVWRPPLMRILLGDSTAELPPLRRRDQWMFLKLWNHFQESLRGESTARLSETAYHLGCDVMARRLLRKGNSTERLFAILTLGYMRDASAWDDLQSQLKRTNSRSSLYAARAMIQIDPQAAARIIVPLLLERDDWEIARVASLLQESREVLGTALVDSLPTLSANRLPRALRLAHALALQVPTPTLLALLRPGQPVEVVIAALRLASRGDTLPAVRTNLQHSDWRVRVQVAKTLGRVGEAQDVPHLMALVQDPEWWVRYRAAQALAGLPFLSHEALDRLQATMTDRYAREIFKQVFAEGELSRQGI